MRKLKEILGPILRFLKLSKKPPSQPQTPFSVEDNYVSLDSGEAAAPKPAKPLEVKVPKTSS